MDSPTWDGTQDASQNNQPAQNQGGSPTWGETQDVSNEKSSIETAKAAVETLERAMAPGVSDFYRAKIEPMFLPESLQTSPEEMLKRREVFSADHPLAKIGIDLAGTGATMVATGGLSSVPGVAAKLGTIGTMGAEGALLGAGNAVSDYSLGDPSLNAQKVLAYVGGGALLGAGLGGLSKFSESAIPYASSKIGKVSKAIAGAFNKEEESVAQGAESAIGEELQQFEKPTTLEQVQKINNDAKFQDLDTGVQQKQKVLDAAQRNPLPVPLTTMQENSLNSADAFKAAQTMTETTPELLELQNIQNKGAERAIEGTINNLAPEGFTPISNKAENGEFARNAFKSLLDAEDKESGELVGQAKKFKTDKKDQLTDLIQHLSVDKAGEETNIGNLFETDKNGNWQMKNLDPNMGVPSKIYENLKGVFNSLKNNPEENQSFEKLFNLRSSLEDGISHTSDTKTIGAVRNLKARFMDYLENLSGEAPESFTQVFKRYAQNQEKKKIAEKAFGIRLKDLPDHMPGLPDENITSKIFGNSQKVSAAKAILPEEDFTKIASNYLSQLKQESTNSQGVFSNKKFLNNLYKKESVLDVAFSDKPEVLQKLKDYALQASVFNESANPSGSGIELIKFLKNSQSKDPKEVALHFLKEQTWGRVEERIKRQQVNDALQGKAIKTSVFNTIGNAIESSSKAVTSKAKSIFNGPAKSIIPAGIDYERRAFDKNAKNVKDYANNPQKLMDDVARSTENIHEYAPNISQGIHNSIISSVGFLNQKLPKPNNELPLSSEWEPTYSQKTKFNRYFEAVSNPMSALDQIKDGTLSNETMEALQATNPHLLDEMKQRVIENINPKTAASLNYSTKIALSKFLGQPLQEGMLPQVFAANQATFSMPQQQARKPTLGGMKEMDFSGRARTQTQKDEGQKNA